MVRPRNGPRNVRRRAVKQRRARLAEEGSALISLLCLSDKSARYLHRRRHRNLHRDGTRLRTFGVHWANIKISVPLRFINANISASYEISATVSISARARLSQKSPGRRCIRFLHIADNCLTAIVHMDVLDADKLVPSVTQASKYLNLRSKCPHQTSGLPYGTNPVRRTAAPRRPGPQANVAQTTSDRHGARQCQLMPRLLRMVSISTCATQHEKKRARQRLWLGLERRPPVAKSLGMPAGAKRWITRDKFRRRSAPPCGKE